jgi:hypothetical protein
LSKQVIGINFSEGLRQGDNIPSINTLGLMKVKGGRRSGLKTSPPSVRRLSIKCETLKIWQTYWLVQLVKVRVYAGVGIMVSMRRNRLLQSSGMRLSEIYVEGTVTWEEPVFPSSSYENDPREMRRLQLCKRKGL